MWLDTSICFRRVETGQGNCSGSSQKNGLALLYASDDLKSDKEIVLEAVSMHGRAFEYASEDLKKDKQFVLEVVQQNGEVLEYTFIDLKQDKEVVLEAVKQKGCVLEYASDDLKSDKEVVLEAVKQDGFALFYASEPLKQDKEIVLEAIKQQILNLASISTDEPTQIWDEVTNEYGLFSSISLELTKDFMDEINQIIEMSIQFCSQEKERKNNSPCLMK
nr:unnamed protein product [Naegleria fowleri]